VVISAAPPSGGGGVDHINEQPPDYWIAKFAESGHKYDPKMTKDICEGFRNAEGVAAFYADNLLFFRRDVTA
jgi:hypothetical protein